MKNEHDDMWELEQQIVETLVSRLETSQSVITYGELASRLKRNYENRQDARAWHFFDASLGRIQDSCVKLNIPSLPVMVVKKAGMNPGAGYAAYYKRSHPEAVAMTDNEISKMQWESVRSFDGWQVLLDYYGIEKRFAGPKNYEAERIAKISFEESKRIVAHINSEVRRSREARTLCIEKKGSTCVICGFNSVEIYGVEGIIHAHHLKPLFEISAGETAHVDPIEDLVPVCPNCHALIHSKGKREWYTIAEAKELYESHRSASALPLDNTAGNAN